jgi:hypothetical protein
LFAYLRLEGWAGGGGGAVAKQSGSLKEKLAIDYSIQLAANNPQIEAKIT